MANELLADIGSAEGLAYEETFQELYWTSYSESSINRVSVRVMSEVDAAEGASRERLVQLGPDDHPRALVVDSCAS